MNLSQRWLKEFVNFSCSPQELADILTMLGIEVEKIHDESGAFRRFVVGEVLEREKHPNADKLSVCVVATGEAEARTIICGAPNVSAGQKVVVALDGAIVPNGGFEIGKRKLRGVESNGMICSKVELGLGEDDGGIWILPEDSVVGTPFAEFAGKDDVIYEISVTPNRADCLSHIGIAREISAYFRTGLCIPLPNMAESSERIEDIASVELPDAVNCPRYAARIVRGVHVQESPEWLKQRLTALGLRPRNNIVDISNLVLMECGHPLHAFDFDCIADGKIIVECATAGEKFTTLDSKERVLDEQTLMICDTQKRVAVAGVMGGENSEITDSTKNVFIESAYFRPSSIRRTAKKLGIQSDASYRFERGTDINNVRYALDRAAQLMAEIGGGSVLGGVIDVYPTVIPPAEITMRFARTQAIIGVKISADEMCDILERLFCTILHRDGESVTVSAPTFRVDISAEIDLVEEIARMYNYDNIPPAMTSTVNFAEERLPEYLLASTFKSDLQAWLRSAGFNEIMTQNMLSPQSAALFTDAPLRLANPLGEELSALRPSLIPAALQTVERNIRFGEKNLRFFDVGKIFRAASDKDTTFIPKIFEQEELLIALAGNALSEHWNHQSRSADFYDIKGILESIVAKFHRKANIEALGESTIFTKNAVCIRHKGEIIAIAGEISPKILKHFGLETPVMILTASIHGLEKLPEISRRYVAVSPYPTVRRDLAFVFESGVPAEDIRAVILKTGGEYLRSVEIFDVFAGKSIGEGKKSIAFSLAFNSQEKTLLDAETDSAVNAIIKAVESKTGGVLRN